MPRATGRFRPAAVQRAAVGAGAAADPSPPPHTGVRKNATMATKKVLVLARGLGKRMQEEVASAGLSAEAARLAGAGLKGLIPIGGRPFLDYLFAAIMQAGFDKACLVVAPENEALREYGRDLNRRTGLHVDFAVQKEPRGTADAVLAGEAFADGDKFVMLNSDNWVAPEGLRLLREARGAEEGPADAPAPARKPARPAGPVSSAPAGLGMPGEDMGQRDSGLEEEYGASLSDEDTAFGVGDEEGLDSGFLLGFDRDGLLRGNIPADRVGRFAVLSLTLDLSLARIVEKPAKPEDYAQSGRLFVSMNAWQFPASIFDACRAIKPSVRGEYEITDAVQWLIDESKANFRVLLRNEPVYDLTGRQDIGPVEEALGQFRVPFPPPQA